jgi:hypothetical protein
MRPGGLRKLTGRFSNARRSRSDDGAVSVDRNTFYWSFEGQEQDQTYEGLVHNQDLFFNRLLHTPS